MACFLLQEFSSKDLVVAGDTAARNSAWMFQGVIPWSLSNAGTSNAITDVAGNRILAPASSWSLVLHCIRRQLRHRGFDNRRSLQCMIVEKTRIQFGRLCSRSKRYFGFAAAKPQWKRCCRCEDIPALCLALFFI